MKSLAIIATLALAASPAAAGQAGNTQQKPTTSAGQRSGVNPYLQPNHSWISISGTVKEAGPDSFLLDYGKGMVNVERDDWDWYAEAYKLLKGDKVRVYGFIDDDAYETTKIEANSVYVQNLGTYFFANSADEESPFVPTGFDLDPNTTMVTGTVTGVQGRTFTIDTGPRQLKVDTATMAYNPLDAEGYQQVRKGDRVSVTGRLENTLFSKRELAATSVLSLSEGKSSKHSATPGERRR